MLVRPAVVFSCALCIGCGPTDHRTTLVEVRDSAAIIIVDNDIQQLSTRCASSADPTLSIGTADGDPDHELYRIFGASRLRDGGIVLVNQGSQEIRFYDRDGRFLRSVGGAGRGPGEFQDAFYLWNLPGDTIWVGDYRPWQFLVFSPEGEWVRTVVPRPAYTNPPGVISVLSDGRMVLAERPATSRGLRFELRRITVVLHGPDGALLDTIGTYPDGRWGTVSDGPGALGLYPLFESFAQITAAGARIVVGHGSDPELRVFEAADTVRLERIVRWTADARAVLPEDIDAERQRIVERYRDMDPDTRRSLVDPLVSEERPVAEAFPAFSSVILGRDGRIWVREYNRPSGPETWEWIAFGRDGVADCRLTMQAFDEMLEFGEDYFLVEHRDELGVERVLQYGLSRREGAS